MKKIIFIAILGLIVISLVGCGTNEEVTSQDNVELQSDDSSNVEINEEQKQDETVYEEKKGILTDTITFGEGDSFYGKIKKHKTSKTAEIEALFTLNDTDEISDFMGEEIFMAPMLINMMCNIMNRGIFSPEELNALNEEGDAQEDSDMWDHLEGYDVTKLSITFIDAEDMTQIAKCVSTGKDSLEFVAYKKYDPEKSFFGAEIGVFEE